MADLGRMAALAAQAWTQAQAMHQAERKQLQAQALARSQSQQDAATEQTYKLAQIAAAQKTAPDDDQKLLTQFLGNAITNGLDVGKALAIGQKLYPNANVPSDLADQYAGMTSPKGNKGSAGVSLNANQYYTLRNNYAKTLAGAGYAKDAIDAELDAKFPASMLAQPQANPSATAIGASASSPQPQATPPASQPPSAAPLPYSPSFAAPLDLAPSWNPNPNSNQAGPTLGSAPSSSPAPAPFVSVPFDPSDPTTNPQYQDATAQAQNAADWYRKTMTPGQPQYGNDAQKSLASDKLQAAMKAINDLKTGALPDQLNPLQASKYATAQSRIAQAESEAQAIADDRSTSRAQKQQEIDDTHARWGAQLSQAEHNHLDDIALGYYRTNVGAANRAQGAGKLSQTYQTAVATLKNERATHQQELTALASDITKDPTEKKARMKALQFRIRGIDNRLAELAVRQDQASTIGQSVPMAVSGGVKVYPLPAGGAPDYAKAMTPSQLATARQSTGGAGSASVASPKARATPAKKTATSKKSKNYNGFKAAGF